MNGGRAQASEKGDLCGFIGNQPITLNDVVVVPSMGSVSRFSVIKATSRGAKVYFDKTKAQVRLHSLLLPFHRNAQEHLWTLKIAHTKEETAKPPRQFGYRQQAAARQLPTNLKEETANLATIRQPRHFGHQAATHQLAPSPFTSSKNRRRGSRAKSTIKGNLKPSAVINKRRSMDAIEQAPSRLEHLASPDGTATGGMTSYAFINGQPVTLYDIMVVPTKGSASLFPALKATGSGAEISSALPDIRRQTCVQMALFFPSCSNTQKRSTTVIDNTNSQPHAAGHKA
ncbi:hypothetical protein JKP88DRAFT_283921 [Tribonema minus]|uniref:Uncharacterized protein n=1 Tax=Tribonema minus TaxID=303371 RepID=A0A835YGJ0_9STRA|nr:hypothetical protein JKP88DRAFT_283921 [Tribonema minus]